MLGIYVSVPVACFRKGLAREYLETEPIPPPATCYGFLLSLVGEQDRRRHIGSRVTPMLLDRDREHQDSLPPISVVLRTVWRCKDKNYWVDPTGKHHIVPPSKKERKPFLEWVREQGWPEPDFSIGLGAGGNARPDYQQLLTDVQLLIWIDSREETGEHFGLESRVRSALDTPRDVNRYGGLSLGESTHLVDEVSLLDKVKVRIPATGKAFLQADRGRLTLPVWVDHVGSAKTRYATGNLVECPADQLLNPTDLPRISPE